MEKSSFFNSVSGDRKYKAEDWADYFGAFISNGVFPAPAVGLQVLAGEGMNVTLKAGKAWINGYYYRNTGDLTLTLGTADGVLNRIDRIVIRWDLTNRTISATVKPSTPSAAPTAPELQRDADAYELCIADIAVNAGATSIAQAAITDRRFNSSLCGICGWMVNNVDTTNLFTQFTNAFETWFAGVQDTLGEDTAGALLNLINANAFQTYTHTKEGTNHELTLASGNDNIKFVATADYAAEDTFTINGEEITAKMPDGNDLSDGYFVSGAVVIGFINGDTVYFVGGGATNTQVIITLTASDNSSMTGRTVTVTNTEDDSVIETFSYSGQAHTVLVPVGTHYRIECSEKQGYVTPKPVEYTATANVPRAITITYQYGTRYGFKREKANSAKDARITYLFNAVGKTPAAMNYTTGEFEYGSWETFINKIARPVMLKTDGTVDYELYHNDQTKKMDGVTASDVANTAYDGNAMVEFGDAFRWVKRYEDSTHEYVIFSDVQFDSTYNAYAHMDTEGTVKDAFYWGMFKGSYVNSKMRSIGTGAVMVNTTRQQEIDRAKANGDGYYTIYKSGHDYIDDLLTLISKSDDTQTAFGKGRCSTNAASANGTLKNKPAFYGHTNGTTDVKVFYIEGYWANVWEGMAGLVLDGANGIKAKMYPPYNLTGAGYVATGIKPSGTSGGYIDTESVTDEAGLIPKTASGSETTYLCDGLWFNNGQVDYALVGGAWSNAGLCGARCVYLDDLASSAYAYFGSRLSYNPPPEAA